jgi:D-glycero-alpha-D-manno-heptose-7-phosphate kinase
MIYRSKAPLRLGLAGGGTDVSPYSDIYGGAILNATISLFAHATIEPIKENKIIIQALDQNHKQSFDWATSLPIDGKLDLLKAVYNRIQQDHEIPAGGFRLTTSVDVPVGSGLGTSSTLVVAILGAFKEMLKIPFTAYEAAQYAYQIERSDLLLAGGKQDQYAASFGGVNFMEFYEGDKVIVNPLHIPKAYLQELENNLLLYFTNTSRESATIITEQVNNVNNKNEKSIAAMHQLKKQAMMMKDALLNGRLDEIGEILDYGFTQKKLMAHNISNDSIEAIYAAAKKAGASGGKISGAGGGGFIVFYCPGDSRSTVIETLKGFGGAIKEYAFADHGLTTWTETPSAP